MSFVAPQHTRAYVVANDNKELEMSGTWKTKYGLRRVRHDPPTIAEALAAASGLTDDREQQIELAASLMELPVEAVRAEAAKLAPARKNVSIDVVALSSRNGAARTVVVERKVVRRPLAKRV